MLELNGLKYSRKTFDGYKYRAIVLFKKDEHIHRLDIYTTDTDKSNLKDVLVNQTKIGVGFVKIDHWVTKEHDDSIDKLLNELFNI